MHLLAREDGPFDLVLHLRRALGGGGLGRAMDCPHCLGLWVAIPLAAWLAPALPQGIILWLAIAGGASLLEKATDGDGAGSVEVLVDDALVEEDRRR